MEGGEGQPSWRSPHHATWSTAKFALRVVSAIVAVALVFVSAVGFAAPPGFNSYPIMGLALAAATLLYNSGQFIAMCVRRSKSEAGRPAVSLGLELVLASGGFAMSGLIIAYTSDVWRWSEYYNDPAGSNDNGGAGGNPDGGDDGTPPDSSYVDHDGYAWFAKSVAACFLASALSLIHFVLFVRACVEVSRQRQARKEAAKPASPPPPPAWQGARSDAADDANAPVLTSSSPSSQAKAKKCGGDGGDSVSARRDQTPLGKNPGTEDAGARLG